MFLEGIRGFARHISHIWHVDNGVSRREGDLAV